MALLASRSALKEVYEPWSTISNAASHASLSADSPETCRKGTSSSIDACSLAGQQGVRMNPLCMFPVVAAGWRWRFGFGRAICTRALASATFPLAVAGYAVDWLVPCEPRRHYYYRTAMMVCSRCCRSVDIHGDKEEKRFANKYVVLVPIVIASGCQATSL